MITLSELLFPLKKASFRKNDLLNVPKTDYIIWLITISKIKLSGIHCSLFVLCLNTGWTRQGLLPISGMAEQSCGIRSWRTGLVHHQRGLISRGRRPSQEKHATKKSRFTSICNSLIHNLFFVVFKFPVTNYGNLYFNSPVN